MRLIDWTTHQPVALPSAGSQPPWVCVTNISITPHRNGVSVVINYFDFPSVSIVPYKTNAPLVVDADAVLVTTVSRQGLQPVPRRHSQVIEVSGPVQHIQFHPRPTLYGFGKP